MALVRAHWGFGSKLMTSIFVPDPSAEEVEQFGRLQRASASADVASQLLDGYYGTDIRRCSRRSRRRPRCCTARRTPRPGSALGREVASLIPGAALVPLPGLGHLFYHGEWEPVLDAVLGFLGGPAVARPRSPAGNWRWPGWSPRG